MAYTPINWQTGDTITAEKLNKMDNGWGVGSTQLFSETVTTAENQGMIMGTFTYIGVLDSDVLTVTFNGTDYSCPRIDALNSYFYGGFTEQGPDFSEYPFAIQSLNGQNAIFTENAGTYTVEVNANTIVTGEDFESAITSAKDVVFTLGTTTWQDVYDALSAGKNCYILYRAQGLIRKDPILYAGQLNGAYIVYGMRITSDGPIEFSHTASDPDEPLA